VQNLNPDHSGARKVLKYARNVSSHILLSLPFLQSFTFELSSLCIFGVKNLKTLKVTFKVSNFVKHLRHNGWSPKAGKQQYSAIAREIYRSIVKKIK
jgi:hypothetical protein